MTYSPTPLQSSTIGARGLNFRVRDGNGWDPSAMITRHVLHYTYKRALQPTTHRGGTPVVVTG